MHKLGLLDSVNHYNWCVEVSDKSIRFKQPNIIIIAAKFCTIMSFLLLSIKADSKNSGSYVDVDSYSYYIILIVCWEMSRDVYVIIIR